MDSHDHTCGSIPTRPLSSGSIRGWQSTGSQVDVKNKKPAMGGTRTLRRPLPPLPSPGGSPGSSPQMAHGRYSDSSETRLASGVHQTSEGAGDQRPSREQRVRPPPIQLSMSHAPQELQGYQMQHALKQETANYEISQDTGEQIARYQKAQEAWETLTTDMIRRWSSNGGKGRKITINASGMVCTTYECHLRRFPGTMLSDMVCEAGGDLRTKSVLFIDRHPFATYEIVNCYRDGFLPVQPPHIPFEVWQSELLHFRMHKCSSKIPGLEAFLRLYSEEQDSAVDSSRPPDDTWQLKVYELLEVPKSSRPAYVISIASIVLVVFSVATVCAETMRECSEREQCVGFLKKSDLAVVSIFTAEYLLRLLVTANKCLFMQNPLNFVDLLSILPTWLALFAKDSKGVQDAADLLRVVRILRVFKIARQYKSLQVLLKTGISARNELGQVAFCFTILVVLSAAVVFYAEQNVTKPHYEPFLSIPHTMWWSIITLCTIGYGDFVPLSPFGKVVGSICCVLGVVMVALPISVISSTFRDEYKEYCEKEKIHEQKLRLQKEREEKMKQQRRMKTVFSSYLGGGSQLRRAATFFGSSVSTFGTIPPRDSPPISPASPSPSTPLAQ